jgi:hypothetical protein
MRLIGGGNEIGFFAFGQEATGVIAFGQVATGVIAVGQLARGVVAVCDRLMSVPIPTAQRPGFYTGLTFRLVVLVAMSVLVWALALHPVLEILKPFL